MLGCVLATVGCTSVPGYVRGEGLRPAEVGARRERLVRWIEEELEQGRTERAFHGLEALRSLPLFGRRAGAERKPSSLGVLATPGAVRATMDADEVLFWEDFERTEDSLAGYARTANYVERPYRRIFSGARIVATAQDARLALGPGELLLSYFMGSRRVYVFAVRTSGIRAVPLPDAPGAWQPLVDDLLGRLALESPDWEAPAARLYRALLGPVAPELASADTLLVAAEGPIAEVPFAALTAGDGAPPLLERYRLSYVPSFSVYLQISGRPVLNAPPRVLAVPAHARGLPPSARVFGSPRVLSGAEASRSGLLREARRHNLLHLEVPMTHVQEASLASGLLLTEGKEGEYLSAAELASVTLPECHGVLLTGAVEPPGAGKAARAAGPLAGALLVAGAPSVVVQRWAVEHAAGEALLLAFLPRMLEVGPAEALRQAQRALRARSATAHPRHWGAFALHGWGK